MYVYYDDGITSQWVEVQANVDNYKTPSQNYVINGAFDIWQRSVGPISAGNGSYAAADRWYVYNNAVQTTTVARETGIVPSGFNTSIKITQTGTSTTPYIMQSIETLNAKYLAGKTVTLSAYVYGTVSTSFGIGVRADPSVNRTPATGYSSSPVTGSSTVGPVWTRITATGVIPANTNTIRIDVFANSPTLGQPFYLAGVQLEEGTIATPFRRNQPNIQAELAACQRYYEKSYDIETTPGTVTEVGAHRHSGSGNATGRHYVPIRFKVEKRTNSYEVNTYNPTATNASWITQNSAQAGLARTPLVENKSTSGMVLNVEDGGYAWAVGNTRGHWAVADEL
jgi:hypothetical protein